MVKDKASLDAFKDYNPPEELRKPPGRPGQAAAAPAPAPTPAAVSTPPPPPPPQPSTPQPSPTQSQPSTPAQSSSSGRIFASPLAKKLANEKGIDLSLIQGSGPENQIRSKDVLNYITKAPAAKPAVAIQQPVAQQPSAAGTSGQFSDIALSNFRSVTAKRLLLSKQTIPHYYLTTELELDNALK